MLSIIKIYDIPIFYMPKFSHPDPSVDRRSGFLPPSFEDTKNLGAGVTIPYFFAMNKDKNFVLTNKLYVSENPLIIGEYHQAFKNSNFLFDFGYTDGFKKTDSKKRPGEKSHFFSEFTKNFKLNDDSNSSFKIKTQEVSNDKYLKLYKLKSDLVDYNDQTLENSIDFTYENDDLFFGFNSSVYETLNEDYVDKYEYIYPDITINKNLIRKSNWLLTSDKLHGCSMLIPKKYIVSAGYFNESLRYTQDYDMWMKLHEMGVKFLLCDEYLLFSRKKYNCHSIG